MVNMSYGDPLYHMLRMPLVVIKEKEERENLRNILSTFFYKMQK